MKLLFKRKPVSAEEQQQRAALKDAERRLGDAEKAHQRRVKDARKSLDSAINDHERRVKDARRALENKRQSKKLGSLAGVTLYDDKIVTPDGTSVLSPEVRADADTAGNLAMSSRVTATRLVTIGIFALAFKKKKKHDTRELYLAVETPDFLCARKLDPNRGAAAKQFAAKIVSAGKQAPHAIEQKRSMVEIAERLLKEAESDRRAIEETTEALRKAEADTAEIGRCREEVESLTSVPA